MSYNRVAPPNQKGALGQAKMSRDRSSDGLIVNTADLTNGGDSSPNHN